MLEEFGEMKPNIVLTEKEVHEMLKKLIRLLKLMKFGKKQERLLREKLAKN